jgi:ribosomal protein L11
MLRVCKLSCSKARPKNVNVEVGGNRFLPKKFEDIAKEQFSVPVYPGKRAIHNWRFFIKPGKAATGPPVGQEFSKLGLKPMDFCKAFNDKTKPVFKDDVDLICRVQVYHDLTYSWRVEPPPTAWFIMRAVKKKRRETGPPRAKGGWCCYITLEMCYEIAKYKQFNFDKWEYPPIEVRARAVANQARRMGIAVIGVDAPNSPVKGQSAAQYETASAQYRAQQWEQWKAFKKDELERAPLSERLPLPDFAKLDEAQLKKAAADPRLLIALYNTSRPQSKYDSAKPKKINATTFQTSAQVKDYIYNWRHETAVPSEDTPFWSREAMRNGIK